MHIIPVIDLKAGVVVHAKHGQRELYQPINSVLCASPELECVIQAYLQLYPFNTFYIADLDAIQGVGGHQALLQTILQRYAHLTFWVDSGFQQAPGLYQGIANHQPVLGSESYTGHEYQALLSFEKRFILSLDYSDTAALGAPELFASDALWPEQVLIMSLPRVGSSDGPDLARLQAMTLQYPQQAFIAAGGIRYFADLQQLKNIGVGTALVASALHSGAINREDLQQLQAP